jgi:hypothetical protein
LAIFEDDDFAIEAIRMFEDAVNEAANEVGVRCAAAFPLAVDLDEDDVVGVDDPGRASPGMPRVCLVKFEAVVCIKVEECVEPMMTALVVVDRAFLHFEDLGVRAVCEAFSGISEAANTDPRTGCRDTFQEFSSCKFHFSVSFVAP